MLNLKFPIPSYVSHFLDRFSINSKQEKKIF